MRPPRITSCSMICTINNQGKKIRTNRLLEAARTERGQKDRQGVCVLGGGNRAQYYEPTWTKWICIEDAIVWAKSSTMRNLVPVTC